MHKAKLIKVLSDKAANVYIGTPSLANKFILDNTPAGSFRATAVVIFDSVIRPVKVVQNSTAKGVECSVNVYAGGTWCKRKTNAFITMRVVGIRGAMRVFMMSDKGDRIILPDVRYKILTIMNQDDVEEDLPILFCSLAHNFTGMTRGRFTPEIMKKVEAAAKKKGLDPFGGKIEEGDTEEEEKGETRPW